ncbi:MAG: ferritin-like domain-containing protein [Burkholderiaceae bacterium]
MPAMSVDDLRNGARHAWDIADPAAKCAQVAALHRQWHAQVRPMPQAPDSPSGEPALLDDHPLADESVAPGRPARPALVAPRHVPGRSAFTPSGRAALLHAVAHIEFNAINLALDVVWRFPAMPPLFAVQWLDVAADECRHFLMLQAELQRDGHGYGDFAAHDGLWEMAVRTRADLLARMALVPRVLEAQGLDATPPIQKRLQAAGDRRGHAILQQILDDEIAHVRCGDRWFRRLARQRRLEPEQAYRDLIAAFRAPWPRPPFNEAARLAAGFTPPELAWLTRRAGEDGAPGGHRAAANPPGRQKH